MSDMVTETMWVDGTPLTVRPIVITDAARLERLFTRLSRQSVQFRFFSPVTRPPQAALLRLADVDHARRDALVALDGEEIVGVARYDARPGATEAEIALTIEDAWQRRGLGSLLARRRAKVARARGYERFLATMLPDNRAALGLIHKVAPDATVRFVAGEYEASLPLVRAS